MMVDSGLWNDATIEGAQWSSDSFNEKAGTCLDFDGDDHYTQIENDNDYSFINGSGDKTFSISCWFKREGDKESYHQGLVSKYGDSRLDREWELYVRKQDDKPAFRLGDGWDLIQIYVVAASTVTDDEWTHITATYDGSETKEGLNIYINGFNNTKSRNERGSYGGMPNSDQPVEIGRRRILNSDTFDGKIDNVRIYDAELSSSDVNSIYEGDISVSITTTATTTSSRQNETSEKIIPFITPGFELSALIWIMSLTILWKKQNVYSRMMKE
jgi:hypothetical protein